MRIHATHAIATVDVAFDLIDDDQMAVDAAVVILAMMIGHLPPSARRALADRLTGDAILLLEHVQA